MAGKVAVMGLLERHGEKGSQFAKLVLPNNKRKHLIPLVEAARRKGLQRPHRFAPSYLRSPAITSTTSSTTRKSTSRAGSHQRLENFWSLLKRAIKGTYVSVEPFHLFRYLDEQAFRFQRAFIE
jgi:hypothetical protein